uniref:Exostosin GT47 domain-containing protein n=1 Tax=Calcidiscus leptoporus TaxID=127549 RepID=A0A7S0JC08_9EUKA
MVPAGDTYISSRLYSAIGAGCLPVIIGDIIIHAAFNARVNYTSFAVVIPEKDFVRHPQNLVALLRRIPPAEVLRRQESLAKARPKILFDVANNTGAAAGTNFLELAVEQCFPRMARCGAQRVRHFNGSAFIGNSMLLQ